MNSSQQYSPAMLAAILTPLLLQAALALDWDSLEPVYPTFPPPDPAGLPQGYRELPHQPPTPPRPGQPGRVPRAGECGVPGGNRIVGGEEATPHSFPWMAALFIDEKVSRERE